MKKVLAVKSTGLLIIGFFAIVFFTAFAIFFALYPETLKDESRFPFIICLGCALIILIVYINEIRKPRIMIEYDADYLYLNYRSRTEKIKLESIILAIPRRSHRSGINTFGYVLIHTDAEVNKIGTVAWCEEVCLRIMKIVKEKQTGEEP